MMNRIGFGVAVAALAAGSAANAGVLYSWEARCVQRIFSDSILNIDNDLGCTAPIRGFVEMPTGYIPGTDYNDPQALIRFTVFDEFFVGYFGTESISNLVGGTARMPASTGVPVWLMSASNALTSTNAPGFRFGSELRFTGSGADGIVIRGADLTARLIPEPPVVSLLAAAAAALLLTRRVRQKPVQD